MSTLHGIVSNGRPVTVSELESQCRALAHRAHEWTSSWCGGPVGLGHLAWPTTAEARHERQPHADPQTGTCVLFDGRLDDRSTLRGALVAAGQSPREDTDAELALRAYLAWGTACPEHLLGDFVIVAWDARSRTLFAARDAGGQCPFYYGLAPTYLAFGSELGAVYALPGMSRAPDATTAAVRLVGTVHSNSTTLFRQARRLPPGHALLARPEALVPQVWRWHAYDFAQRTRLESDEAYAARFGQCLEAAVWDRSRAAGPIAADLSGGLDSSAVCAVAAAAQRRGRWQGGALHALTIGFPGLRCDERSYARDVALSAGLSHREVAAGQWAVTAWASQPRRYLDLADYPNGSMATSERAVARELGARVLLGGMGGDEWLSGSPLWLTDAAARGDWRGLARAWWYGAGVGELLRYGLWNQLPLAWRRPRQYRRARSLLPSWLRADFAREVGLVEALTRPLVPRPGASWSQTALVDAFEGGWTFHSYEMEERSAAADGLEIRTPLTDRRLVELVLSLPDGQRQRGGDYAASKWVLRQAMRGLLPESVRRRGQKALFDDVLFSALRVLAPMLPYRKLHLAELGWLEPGEFERCTRRAVDNRGARSTVDGRGVFALWCAIALEFWLEACGEGQQGLQIA